MGLRSVRWGENRSLVGLKTKHRRSSKPSTRAQPPGASGCTERSYCKLAGTRAVAAQGHMLHPPTTRGRRGDAGYCLPGWRRLGCWPLQVLVCAPTEAPVPPFYISPRLLFYRGAWDQEDPLSSRSRSLFPSPALPDISAACSPTDSHFYRFPFLLLRLWQFLFLLLLNPRSLSARFLTCCSFLIAALCWQAVGPKPCVPSLKLSVSKPTHRANNSLLSPGPQIPRACGASPWVSRATSGPLGRRPDSPSSGFTVRWKAEGGKEAEAVESTASVGRRGKS